MIPKQPDRFFTRTARIRALIPAATAFVATFLALDPAVAQTLQWATTVNGINAPALEEAEGVVPDGAGGVFVTGLSGAGSGSAICTLRISAAGAVVWKRVEATPSLCGGMWGRTPITRDSAGNVVVVGAEYNGDLSNWNPLLLRMAPNGVVVSRKVFDLGPYASFDAVAPGADGQLHVAAHNNPNNGNPHVVHALKIGAAGEILWSRSYTPPIFWGTRHAVVAGDAGVFTAAGGRVFRHDPSSGDALWEKEISMSNGGSPLALDGSGRLHLISLPNAVVRIDSNGNATPAFTTSGILVSDLDLDAAGNVFVTGSTPATSSRGSDIATQRYDAAGNRIWSVTYGKSGPYSDDGLAVAVQGGFVFVGGSRYNKNLDMCALKYTGGN